MPVLNGCETTIIIRNGGRTNTLYNQRRARALFGRRKSIPISITTSNPWDRCPTPDPSTSTSTSTTTTTNTTSSSDSSTLNNIPSRSSSSSTPSLSVPSASSLTSSVSSLSSITIASSSTNSVDSTSTNRDMMEENRKVPIIAVTSLTSKAEKEYYLSIGMDDVFTKPLSKPALLIDAVKRHLDAGVSAWCVMLDEEEEE
ncbi:hypothetical protein HDU76_010330, partial [Blyttiomyces sp. JEL0837]